MGWPFKPEAKSKAVSNSAVGSKQGIFDKLIGKKQASKTPQASANKLQGQWNLSNESFDAVTQLLEETRQTSPSQPLNNNPYRTSLSLDDTPEVASEVPKASTEPPHSELSPPKMPQNKINQWEFNANEISFPEKPSSHREAQAPLPEMEAIVQPIDEAIELKSLIDDALLAPPDFGFFEVETIESLQVETALETFVQVDSLQLNALHSNVELTNELHIEENLDDFGLVQPIGSLPEGASLQTLMDNNVLNFISASKDHKTKKFKISSAVSDLRHEAQLVMAPASIMSENNATNQTENASSWFQSGVQPSYASDFEHSGQTLSEALETSINHDWLSQETQTQENQTIAIDFQESVLIQPIELSLAIDFAADSFSTTALPQLDIFSDGIAEHYSQPNISDTVLSEDNYHLDPLLSSSAAYFFEKENSDTFNQDSDNFQPVELTDAEPNDLSTEFLSTQFTLDSSDSLPDQLAWPEPEEQKPLSVETDNIETNVLNDIEYQPIPLSDDLTSFEDMDTEHNYELGLFEFHQSASPSQAASLDLDEDVQVYQEYLMPKETVSSNNGSASELTETYESQLNAYALVTEECLEPPQLLDGQLQAQPISEVHSEALLQDNHCNLLTETPNVHHIKSFEARILFQESRFTKLSIDYLVNSYFSQNN